MRLWLSPQERSDLAERFLRFAEDEAAGSSPLYEVCSRAAADRPEVLELLAAAEGGQRRPNLLFAAVHDLLLEGGSSAGGVLRQPGRAGTGRTRGRRGVRGLLCHPRGADRRPLCGAGDADERSAT